MNDSLQSRFLVLVGAKIFAEMRKLFEKFINQGSNILVNKASMVSHNMF